MSNLSLKAVFSNASHDWTVFFWRWWLVFFEGLKTCIIHQCCLLTRLFLVFFASIVFELNGSCIVSSCCCRLCVFRLCVAVSLASEVAKAEPLLLSPTHGMLVDYEIEKIRIPKDSVFLKKKSEYQFLDSWCWGSLNIEQNSRNSAHTGL
jgi:hypothetical protein